MYNYKGHRDAYLELVEYTCSLNFRVLMKNKELFYMLCIIDKGLPIILLGRSTADTIEGITNLLDCFTDWLHDYPVMIVTLDKEELMDNESAVKTLVTHVCEINNMMLQEQLEVLRAIVDYDCALPQDHRDAIEFVLDITTYISKWMADHPEVIFDYRL